jgi:hypothetical protein
MGVSIMKLGRPSVTEKVLQLISSGIATVSRAIRVLLHDKT